MHIKQWKFSTLHLIATSSLILYNFCAIVRSLTVGGFVQNGVSFIISINFAEIIRVFAFPLFAYIMVEVFQNKEYFKMSVVGLLGLAVVIEIPFNYIWSNQFFYGNLNNMFFTLLLGTSCLIVMDTTWNDLLKIIGIIVILFVGSSANCDFSLGGILLVLLFQLTYSYPFKWIVQILGMLIFAWISLFIASRSPFVSMINPGYISFWGKQVNAQYLYVLSLIPIAFCNNKYTSKSRMWCFFSYGALIISYWIRLFVMLKLEALWYIF